MQNAIKYTYTPSPKVWPCHDGQVNALAPRSPQRDLDLEAVVEVDLAVHRLRQRTRDREAEGDALFGTHHLGIGEADGRQFLARLVDYITSFSRLPTCTGLELEL